VTNLFDAFFGVRLHLVDGCFEVFWECLRDIVDGFREVFLLKNTNKVLP
jgi:hypothetical protein